MRIVCTVTNDLAQDQRMDRICRSLVEASHEVTLVGRLLPTSRALGERPYATHRIACRRHYGKAFYAEYNYRLHRTLRHWNIDVLCAVDLDTLLAGSLLRRSLGCRLVFDAHEWFSETPEVVGRPFVRKLWRQLGRRLVPVADARYTVAPRLAERLAEEYGVPFATVRNLPHRRSGPAPAPITERDTGGRKVVLYQGMLNPGRGLAEAIEAVAGLPDHELWLVGSGPEEGALRRCSERLACRQRVWFAGFRDPAELPRFTASAWVGLNLLDAVSPSYYYSLANKALDYPQAGLPSVQMDFPEYRSINERFGCYRLLPRLEVGILRARLKELSTDPTAYATLQAGCRNAARELTWEAEEPTLLAIYAALK